MFHGYRSPYDNLPHMDATFIIELSSRDFPYRTFFTGLSLRDFLYGTFFTGLSLQDFPYATFQIAVNAKSIPVPVPVPVPVPKVITTSSNETG